MALELKAEGERGCGVRVGGRQKHRGGGLCMHACMHVGSAG